MPTERIAMRRVREMLRLRLDAGLSLQEVAFRSGLARSTLREMVGRFERSGLAWPLPLPLDLSDAGLEVRLYGDAGSKRGHRRKPEPDWAVLHRELKRNKNVTLETLWSEYNEVYPDGYRYSRDEQGTKAIGQRLLGVRRPNEMEPAGTRRRSSASPAARRDHAQGDRGDAVPEAVQPSGVVCDAGRGTIGRRQSLAAVAGSGFAA